MLAVALRRRFPLSRPSVRIYTALPPRPAFRSRPFSTSTSLRQFNSPRDSAEEEGLAEEKGIAEEEDLEETGEEATQLGVDEDELPEGADLFAAPDSEEFEKPEKEEGEDEGLDFLLDEEEMFTMDGRDKTDLSTLPLEEWSQELYYTARFDDKQLKPEREGLSYPGLLKLSKSWKDGTVDKEIFRARTIQQLYGMNPYSAIQVAREQVELKEAMKAKKEFTEEAFNAALEAREIVEYPADVISHNFREMIKQDIPEWGGVEAVAGETEEGNLEEGEMEEGEMEEDMEEDEMEESDMEEIDEGFDDLIGLDPAELEAKIAERETQLEEDQKIGQELFEQTLDDLEMQFLDGEESLDDLEPTNEDIEKLYDDVHSLKLEGEHDAELEEDEDVDEFYGQVQMELRRKEELRQMALAADETALSIQKMNQMGAVGVIDMFVQDAIEERESGYGEEENGEGDPEELPDYLLDWEFGQVEDKVLNSEFIEHPKFLGLEPKDRQKELKVDLITKLHNTNQEDVTFINMQRDPDRVLDEFDDGKESMKLSLKQMDQPEEFNAEEADEDYDGDPMEEPELTAYGYEQLELQRTFLKYLRLTEFELPTFTRFHKPFNPPSPSALIQVRTQHYQGEEHSGDRKCVITVPVYNLPLPDFAKHKFRVLAGPRWDAANDTVKISCELFPELDLNSKWCNDTLNKLIAVASDASDKMLDVPLDLRAHEKRKKKRGAMRVVGADDFPLEWLPKPLDSKNRLVPLTL